MQFSEYAPAAREIFEQGYPSYHDDPEYYANWWEEQIRRCISGYKVSGNNYIPGNYYFHLNFAKILRYDGNKNDKTYLTPLYRDLDHEYFMAVKKAEENHRGIIVLKARRKGFTVDNTSIILCNWLFNPGSESAIGAFMDNHVDGFRNKLLDSYSRLPPELYQRFTGTKTMEAVVEEKKAQGWTKESSSGSRIYFRSFGAKQGGAGVFRGLSLKYALFEEAGENPILEKCLLSSEECFKEGDMMYGVPIIGGTSNLMSINSEDFKRIYYNHDKYKLDKFFVPASKVYYPFFDEQKGKSDTEGAEKVIEKEYAEKFALEDKTAYYILLQEKPLKEEHAFSGNSSMNKLPMSQINKQISILDSGDFKKRIMRGNLFWETGSFNPSNPKVKWVPDDEGKYKIVDSGMPLVDKYYGLDIGGVDTYFYNTAPSSPSMGSCFIYRRFCAHNFNMPSEMFVAEYTDRELTTEMFYENCLKLAVFYNCKLLVEYDEQFAKYFGANKALKYLKERPLAADSPNSKSINRYMIHMKVHQKTLGTGLLHDYLVNHYDNIFFRDLLEECKVFGVKNTDRVMAAMICLIHDLDVVRLEVRDMEKEKLTKQSQFPSFEIRNGMVVPVYEKNNNFTTQGDANSRMNEYFSNPLRYE